MTSALQELQQASPRRGNARPTIGYYRQPNGWITASPITALEEVKYIKEGWTRLARYGAFQFITPYSADHPLELLLMLGGAHEMCLDQIIQNGFGSNPPMVPTCGQPFTQYHPQHQAYCWDGARPAVFPQLAGVENLGPFPCRFCGQDKATEKIRNRHEDIIHKTEKGDIRTGEALGNVIAQALRPSEAVATAPSLGQQESNQALLEQIESLKGKLAAATRPIVKRRRAVKV